MSLDVLIRGCKYDKAIKLLEEKGLSEWAIQVLMDYEEIRDPVGYVLTKRRCEYWPDDHTNDIKSLMAHNLIACDSRNNDLYYWMAPKGITLVHTLKSLYRKEPDTLPTKCVPVDPEKFNTDLNLGRDGLLLTASKLFWCFTNRKVIRQRQLESWLIEFQESQGEIDQAIIKILTPRDIEILEHKPVVNPYWNEAMQREQNDNYWMIPSAFWLNPRGIDAEPTPAPDWWTAPKYEPKVKIASNIDSIVEASLLPPPPEFVPTNPEVVVEKHRKKADDECIDELLYELEQINRKIALERRREYRESFKKNSYSEPTKEYSNANDILRRIREKQEFAADIAEREQEATVNAMMDHVLEANRIMSKK